MWTDVGCVHLCAGGEQTGLFLCSWKAGSAALVVARTEAWGRAAVFAGISRFLCAVKSGSCLSPAMAKQDTWYSIIA